MQPVLDGLSQLLTGLAKRLGGPLRTEAGPSAPEAGPTSVRRAASKAEADPPYGGPDLLSAMPADVRAALALRLAPRDLAALSCTGRAWADTARGEASLWREMAEQRFGREAARAALRAEDAAGGEARGAASPWAWLRSFRRARDSSGRIAIAAASVAAATPPGATPPPPEGSLPARIAIMWVNEQTYWRCGESPAYPDATFSAVAHCSMVCWFDVRGATQRPLPPGRYAVTWRVRLEGHAPQETFNASASVEGADESDAAARAECRIAPADWPPPHQWRELCIGELKVPAGSGSIVEVALWKHSGNWVMGISLDYVQLKRLD